MKIIIIIIIIINNIIIIVIIIISMFTLFVAVIFVLNDDYVFVAAVRRDEIDFIVSCVGFHLPPLPQGTAITDCFAISPPQ